MQGAGAVTGATRPLRVLVIEDTPLNLELASDLLEAAGYIAIGATSAEAGLDLARTERPDLILMDLSLPRMDGLAATRALKADPATRDIPVVALSARAMPEDREQALAAGCAGYLTKPIDTRAFGPRIAGLLAAGRGRPLEDEA